MLTYTIKATLLANGRFFGRALSTKVAGRHAGLSDQALIFMVLRLVQFFRNSCNRIELSGFL